MTSQITSPRKHFRGDRAASLRMLFYLNRLYDLKGLHIYSGSVPRKIVARRRARNKVARLSRRANRA
jgi:hypothetical protein